MCLDMVDTSWEGWWRGSCQFVFTIGFRELPAPNYIGFEVLLGIEWALSALFLQIMALSTHNRDAQK